MRLMGLIVIVLETNAFSHKGSRVLSVQFSYRWRQVPFLIWKRDPTLTTFSTNLSPRFPTMRNHHIKSPNNNSNSSPRQSLTAWILAIISICQCFPFPTRKNLCIFPIRVRRFISTIGISTKILTIGISTPIAPSDVSSIITRLGISTNVRLFAYMFVLICSFKTIADNFAHPVEWKAARVTVSISCWTSIYLANHTSANSANLRCTATFLRWTTSWDFCTIMVSILATLSSSYFLSNLMGDQLCSTISLHSRDYN